MDRVQNAGAVTVAEVQLGIAAGSLIVQQGNDIIGTFTAAEENQTHFRVTDEGVEAFGTLFRGCGVGPAMGEDLRSKADPIIECLQGGDRRSDTFFGSEPGRGGQADNVAGLQEGWKHGKSPLRVMCC